MIEKINDAPNIKVLKTKTASKTHPYKYLLDHPFSNIWINSRKGSGKTNVIWNFILHTTIPKKIKKIIFFSSSFNNDETSQAMKDKLDKHNIAYDIYDDIYDYDDKGRKICILDNIIENEVKFELENEKDKIKKCKYNYPLYLFIYDDIPQCLRSGKKLEKYIKLNRHFKIINIVSSHFFTDISPAMRANFQVLILFKNINTKNLESIYDEYINNISYQDFLNIYFDSTKDPYSFLYIDTNGPSFRKNFNYKYNI